MALRGRDRLTMAVAPTFLGRAVARLKAANLLGGLAKRPTQVEHPAIAGMQPGIPKVQFPEWSNNFHEWYALADRSSLAKAILQALSTRLTRNGLEWKQRYAAVCLQCGNEMAEVPTVEHQEEPAQPEARTKAFRPAPPTDGSEPAAEDEDADDSAESGPTGDDAPSPEAEPKVVCPECGSAELRFPDWGAVRAANSFLKRVNQNGMTMRELVKSTMPDIHIADEGYIVRIKAYEYDAEGVIKIGDDGYPVFELKEWMRGDPRSMRVVSDDYGHLGKLWYVCLRCRDQGLHHGFPGQANVEYGRAALKPNQGKCPTCGGWLYDAHYVSMGQVRMGGLGGTGPFDAYYIAGEVCHWQQYNPGPIYSSRPPMAGAYMALSLLHQMQSWLWEHYALRRNPRVIVGLKGAKLNWVTTLANYLRSVAQTDPEAIPMVGMPSESDGWHVLDLDKPPKELQFVETRRTLASEAGAVWQVTPNYLQEPASGGLAQEGLQVSMTEDVIHEGQQCYNDKPFPVLVEQDLTRIHPGIIDFELRLVPTREEDQARTDAQRKAAVEEATAMRAMGYEVKIEEQETKLRFSYSGTPTPAPQFSLDGLMEAVGSRGGREEPEPADAQEKGTTQQNPFETTGTKEKE